MTEVVVLLREVIDDSGLGLRGLAERLRVEHRGGPPPRGYQTLSKRLRGIGLQNEPHLIYSIVSACVGEGRRQELTSRVTELLADARVAAPPSDGASRRRASATDRKLIAALDEINTLRKKLDRLQSKASRAEKQLLEARELLVAAHAASASSGKSPAPTSPAADSAAPRTEARSWTSVVPPPRETPTENTSPRSSTREVSTSAEDVIRFLNSVPALRERTAASLRAAFDSVLDGERTGRYDLNTLGKSEKVYLGSRVEHFLWEAWGLKGRKHASIASVPLKFTWTSTWVLAPEHIGRVCLLVRASDTQSRWDLGVLEVAPEHLNQGGNRDGKQTLSAAGRGAIQWLFKDAPLPENVLLHLDQQSLAQVLSPDDDVPNAGQARTNNLFRVVQGRLLNRAAVQTVAMQTDAPRRVRDARRHLRREGIIILGHQLNHPQIAEALGLPRPLKGQWVSIRVTRQRPDHGDTPFVELDGQRWAVADPNDTVEEGPDLS
ncbi:NaeI family type II restriction endonuclease [Streptomyces sp. LNU-CPARS28]|uniref:NaeI family type II restriction endonuclease n=1 Tax=Streptomyces sp. LNU-CPARS28 TaxID=3137371 RepID=UPI0031347CAB